MNTILEKIKLDFKWAIASRTPLLMLIIAFVIDDVLYPSMIYAAYTKYQIPGWTINQILFIIGTAMLIIGIQEMFLNSFRWDTLEDIKSGRMDYHLVRPKNILRIMGISLFIPSINDVIVGLILIFIFNPGGNILNYILLVMTAIVFLEGFNLLIVELAVRYIEVEEVWYIGNSLAGATEWPIRIFPRWLRWILILFPVVLVGYGPVSAYIFNNLSDYVIPIVIAFAILTFALLNFNRALRKYQSAGG